MNGHIARKLARTVVDMYSELPGDDVQLASFRYEVTVARWKSHLSKDGKRMRIRHETRLACTDALVQRFLRKCEERRLKLPQPPKRIAWENRPKWNGVITNLIPVLDDTLVVSA